tara:strand:- start:610 stop:1338 length:729 start_codon:yes stop_codon:yes gene_type:complete
MSEYDKKMQKLRESLPQGSTVDKRSKEDQAKFKRIESSVAYPTSDAETGVTEKPGDLGEIAFPQSDRMDAEEALFAKMTEADNDEKNKPKSSAANVGKDPSRASTTTIKHKRSNYAPQGRKKRTGPGTSTPKGPKSLDDYQTKQTDEYKSIADKVIPEDSYKDFKKDKTAQVSFGQSAALKSYLKKADTMDHETEIRTLPSGEEIEVVIFPDGSEYYQETDAVGSDLKPGDILRLRAPRRKR